MYLYIYKIKSYKFERESLCNMHTCLSTFVWSEYERASTRLLNFKEDLCQDILLGKQRFCITSVALKWNISFKLC